MKKFRIQLLVAMMVIHSTLEAQSIAAGGGHSLAICNDSTVKAFGENSSGQLGNGSTTDSNIPVSVIGLSSITAVSGGGDQNSGHSLALKSNGTVYSWGSNPFGALGNGSTTNSLIPNLISTLNNMTAISAGGWHSVALKNDSTIWAWGSNSDGQLGDGTIIDKLIPTQIGGISSIISISAGAYHTLAIKSDSTVWSWGDNVSGQLGDGTTIDRTIPVQVIGLNGVIKVAAGRFFSIAVKSDGSVWAWGDNVYGQLGNGSNTSTSIPTQVLGLTGVTYAIAAAGSFHCLAVKSDGSIWAWGRNTNGNLGNNTTLNSTIPVQLLGISSAVGVGAGFNFSILYKNDGTFWGCGRNSSGQLGDGTNTQRNQVVQSTTLCSVLQPAVRFPLPLNILEMSAKNTITGNEIKWSANCNLSTDKFIVQYSEDGQKFNDIGEIKNIHGSEGCQSLHEYKYLHQNPNSVNYYRIAELDLDGDIFYSRIALVKIFEDILVSIYPNPVSEKLLVKTNLKCKMVLKIFDMNGRIMYSDDKFASDQELTVGFLQKGIYYLSILLPNYQFNSKFVKE